MALAYAFLTPVLQVQNRQKQVPGAGLTMGDAYFLTSLFLQLLDQVPLL